MEEESLRRNPEGWNTGESSGRHLGALWRLLEAVLGPAGRHLASLWEASGRPLGGPWEAPGRPLGSLWEALGARGHLDSEMYQNQCVLQRLRSRPPVSHAFWRGDPHDLL